MGTLKDPWHSRPIDVHRWSDHPEIVGVVEQVWAEHFPDQGKSGPKPKTTFRHQLRVLLLDLYVAWLEDQFNPTQNPKCWGLAWPNEIVRYHFA